jgi:hypothetical protein
VSKRRIGGGPATTAVGLVGRCGISERGSVWVVGEETGRWAMRGSGKRARPGTMKRIKISKLGIQT